MLLREGWPTGRWAIFLFLWPDQQKEKNMALDKKYVPVGDRILVIQDEASRMTGGGLYIPDTMQEKPLTGIAVRVGPGIMVNGQLQPMYTREGDRVIFNRYAGKELMLDGEIYMVIRDPDVNVVIRS